MIHRQNSRDVQRAVMTTSGGMTERLDRLEEADRDRLVYLLRELLLAFERF